MARSLPGLRHPTPGVCSEGERQTTLTAKLNGIDPQAWLTDLLARLPGHPAKRLAEFLPWNWSPPAATLKAA